MPEPLLFQPFATRGVTFRNRIVVSPMCQYVAVEGEATQWHFAHHGRMSLGGVGGAIVEATAVTPEGRITPGCLGLWDDRHIPGLRRIADIYHAQGIPLGVQLAHAGRKASAARPWDGAAPLTADSPERPWRAVGPSAIATAPGWPEPHALETGEIRAVVRAFADATRRALQAGVDFIEIHGAHGYLIHSFLSPLANRRTDEYGGSFDNRMRFALDVSGAVRAALPAEKPLFYRVSAVDGAEGGVVLDDTVALAGALKGVGVDLVDCSSGGIHGPTPSAVAKVGPGFQVPYAAAIRREADIPTMAVGLITQPAQAEAVLAAGQADLIAMARELLADSNFPYRAARELGLANPHEVLPRGFAFYLGRRANQLASADRRPA